MNTSSAEVSSASTCPPVWGATKSDQVTSRPGVMGTSTPRFESTTMRSTVGDAAAASSAHSFIRACFPRLQVPSAVKISFTSASWRRAATADGAKPEKIGR